MTRNATVALTPEQFVQADKARRILDPIMGTGQVVTLSYVKRSNGEASSFTGMAERYVGQDGTTSYGALVTDGANVRTVSLFTVTHVEV